MSITNGSYICVESGTAIIVPLKQWYHAYAIRGTGQVGCCPRNAKSTATTLYVHGSYWRVEQPQPRRRAGKASLSFCLILPSSAKGRSFFAYSSPRSNALSRPSASCAGAPGLDLDAQVAAARGCDVLKLPTGDAAHAEGEEGVGESGKRRAASASLLILSGTAPDFISSLVIL